MTSKDSRNPKKPKKSKNAKTSRNPAPPPLPDDVVAALLRLRSLLRRPRSPHARQGPGRPRSVSPAWDVTGLRIRRRHKQKFERFRALFSFDGRSPPHWEVFPVLLALAERQLPKELRPLLRD